MKNNQERKFFTINKSVLLSNPESIEEQFQNAIAGVDDSKLCIAKELATISDNLSKLMSRASDEGLRINLCTEYCTGQSGFAGLVVLDLVEE